MKRVLLMATVLALIALVAFPAFAQEEKPMRFGIKGGLNMMNIWGSYQDVWDDFGDVNWAYGAAAGVFMYYKINPYFTIQPEALWYWKGYIVSVPGGVDKEIDIQTKLYYIDIPVLARITIPTESAVKPALFLGPYVGFKIGDGWDMDPDPDPDLMDDIKENWNAMLNRARSVDWGFVFGGGLDYELSNGGLLVFDVRYMLGLQNIFEAPTGSDEPDMKHHCLTIMLGYGF